MRFNLQSVFSAIVVVAIKTFQISVIRAAKVHWTIPVVDSPSDTIRMAEVATVAVVRFHMTNLKE